jgi:hypothetical protein
MAGEKQFAVQEVSAVQREVLLRGWSADGQEAGKRLTRIVRWHPPLEVRRLGGELRCVRWQRAAIGSTSARFKTSEARRPKTSLARLPLLPVSDLDARFRLIARVRKR